MYAPVALALERTQPATLLLRLEAPFIYDREKSEPDIGSLSVCADFSWGSRTGGKGNDTVRHFPAQA